jgi:putative spermidine/putrescine transport system ATP-binding protein
MVLEVRGLTVGYNGKEVVRQCSFSVNDGETLVLMGPSGCGKTTLLLSIIGVLEPMGGKIMLNGRDLTKIPIEKRRIGYLPQDYGLFPHLNVLENVGYGLKISGVAKEEREKISLEMLSLVGLRQFAYQRISQLSGGQKQRVGIARALAVHPDLLLLDEPLSNIDQLTKSNMAHALRKMFEHIKIPKIVVTHAPYEASVLADRMAVMLDGKIVQSGTPKSVFSHPKNSKISKLLYFEKVEMRQG